MPSERRRDILKSIGIGAAGTFGITSLHSVSGYEIKKSEYDIYSEVQGTNSAVSDPEAADVAVFDDDSEVDHSLTAGAVNGGTAVGFVGSEAKRRLISALIGTSPESASDTDDRPRGVDDIDYSFGYEYDPDGSTGVAIALPEKNGTLAIHGDSSLYVSDEQRFATVLEEFETYSTSSSSGGRSGYSDEWEYDGRAKISNDHCPAGDLVRIVWAYEVPTEPGTVSFAWQDRMTPGDNDESSCDSQYRNTRAMRRPEFGPYDGDVIDFGPTTTKSSKTANVNMSSEGSASVGYSYEIEEVDIEASESIEDQAIKWEHDVDYYSSTAGTTFVSEPGIVVDYDGDPDYVKFNNEHEYTWEHPSYYKRTARGDGEFTWHFD
jgi:hypothetical protein